MNVDYIILLMIHRIFTKKLHSREGFETLEDLLLFDDFIKKGEKTIICILFVSLYKQTKLLTFN